MAITLIEEKPTYENVFKIVTFLPPSGSTSTLTIEKRNKNDYDYFHTSVRLFLRYTGSAGFTISGRYEKMGNIYELVDPLMNEQSKYSEIKKTFITYSPSTTKNFCVDLNFNLNNEKLFIDFNNGNGTLTVLPLINGIL
jgi:hypothetical protein